MWIFIFLFFLADSSFAQFKIDVDKKVVDEFFKKKTISDLKIGEEGFVQLGYAYLCMTENRQFLLSPSIEIEKENKDYGNSFKIIKKSDYSATLTSTSKGIKDTRKSIMNLLQTMFRQNCGKLPFNLIDQDGRVFQFTDYDQHKKIKDGKWIKIKNINGFGSITSLLDNL